MGGVAYVVCATFALLLQGCEESLPPHEQPPVVMEAAVSMAGGEYSVYMVGPRNTVSTYDPARIVVNLKNIYQEVLQDSVGLNGSIEIWDVDHGGSRAVVSVRNASLTPSPTYPGHMETVLPGAYVIVALNWNHFSTSGDPLPFWNGVPTHPAPGDTYLYPILETLPIHLAIRASVQLYALAGRVTSPVFYVDVTYILHLPKND